MTIGISDEHLELHSTASRWVGSNVDPSVPRATLDAEEDALPPFWDALTELGWFGLHLPEQYGGEGYGLAELAVVVEELGRACAPGPFVPTVLAGAIVDALGSHDQCAELLAGLCDGSRPAAVAFGGPGLSATALDAKDGALVVAGSTGPVLGAGVASLLVLPVEHDGSWIWCVFDRDEVEVSVRPSLDATRRVGDVSVDSVVVPAGHQLHGDGDGRRVGALAATIFAAECTGGAAWCVDTATEHAKVRVQFGRPIGQFQAVKHRCADMLLRLEHARAAAWDAARVDGEPDHADEFDERDLTASVAGALCTEMFFGVSKDCIQVLGGIGYTWEHDAHLYVKRAAALRQLLGGAAPWRHRVAEHALSGHRRRLSVELPPEAGSYRAEVRALVAELQGIDKSDWNAVMAERGYLVPYWPRPWGRDAGPIEQLVIDEELKAARIRRPHLQVGGWVLPTLIAHGSAEQQERWVGPTLRGEVLWCQMFSEPGAGSDLASLTTRAERVDGGWELTGQKVWTTMAHVATWAICLARTDPDVDKHEGITCFMVDMATPGIDIRPLRELTGQELFNEVFLDAVFVPDDCVVGGVDNGWNAARTTLENERVSMGSGSSFGPGVEAVIDLVARRGHAEDAVVLDQLGALVAEAEGIAVLGLRSTLRALAGAEPGPESSVRKLLGVEHEQEVQEMGLSLLGPDGAASDGDGAVWIAGFLGNRALSIAGGTSDVQRNIIAERLLGLPKDP